MAVMYKHSQVVSASDYCITVLVETIRTHEQNRFSPAQVLDQWAHDNGIAEEDRKSFVTDARAMFEVEVIVRGLAEHTRRAESGDIEWKIPSQGKFRPSLPLFSPVYTLFEPKRGSSGRSAAEENED